MTTHKVLMSGETYGTWYLDAPSEDVAAVKFWLWWNEQPAVARDAPTEAPVPNVITVMPVDSNSKAVYAVRGEG